jgi:magnesium chelatase accessory protein
MDWTRDLPTWSHPALSRRVVLGPHRWHVQEAGEGPMILLLPGAGASVHTWRDLIGPLARTHSVVALDLPGQGFTQTTDTSRSGLEEMSVDIAALCRSKGWDPAAIIGHSAGAAIALRLSQVLGVPKIVGINPALAEFDGIAGWLFPVLAKLLALNPLTPSLFAFGATPARARRLIEGTGSRLSDEGLAYYTRLTADRAHVNGALQMMARWSLDGLLADLPEIKAEVLFLTGANDKAVPPDVADRAAERLPHCTVHRLDGLGHLAHEEDPVRVLSEIEPFLSS